MLEEFKKFAIKGNVIDLAVGVILGAAFSSVVGSLVKDVLMPPLGFLMGGLDFSNFFFVFGGGEYPTLEAAQKAGAVTIAYGVFINTVINFVIVSFAIFLLVKQVNRLKKKEEAVVAPPPRQEVLLEEIRNLLRR